MEILLAERSFGPKEEYKQNLPSHQERGIYLSNLDRDHSNMSRDKFVYLQIFSSTFRFLLPKKSGGKNQEVPFVPCFEDSYKYNVYSQHIGICQS